MPAPSAQSPRLIGISLGDPAGIGPEIVVKALAARPDLRVCVFGEPHVLTTTAERLGMPAPAEERVHAVSTPSSREIVAGRPNLASAQAQLTALQTATDAALDGRIAGLCTAPISKEWIARVGFDFPGHTEYLAHRAGVTEFAMMLAGPRLRTVLATTHVALRDVPRVLTPADVARAAVLAARTLLHDFGVGRPRIAVAGLNPHAGEGGRFGDEETTVVTPGIRAARRRLEQEQNPAAITGPYPPDAVFRQASLGAFDAVVALYHDQGLIPIKLLHFDEGVNVTLGLPFVRTSPDHGTAYDIAGSGRANPSSFLAALDLAVRLSARRPA